MKKGKSGSVAKEGEGVRESVHDARAFHRDFFSSHRFAKPWSGIVPRRGGLNRHIYVRVFFSFLSWDFVEVSLVLLVGLTRNGLLLPFLLYAPPPFPFFSRYGI